VCFLFKPFIPDRISKTAKGFVQGRCAAPPRSPLPPPLQYSEQDYGRRSECSHSGCFLLSSPSFASLFHSILAYSHFCHSRHLIPTSGSRKKSSCLKVKVTLSVCRLAFLACFPKTGLCDLHPVCVSVHAFLSTSECLNQSLRNLAL
jgi:hypothetical protein